MWLIYWVVSSLIIHAFYKRNCEGRGLVYLPISKADASNTNRGLNNYHILQEPNSIIVLLLICIYIELRVNACIVRPYLRGSHYKCFQDTTKLRYNVVFKNGDTNSDLCSVSSTCQ